MKQLGAGSGAERVEPLHLRQQTGDDGPHSLLVLQVDQLLACRPRLPQTASGEGLAASPGRKPSSCSRRGGMCDVPGNSRTGPADADRLARGGGGTATADGGTSGGGRTCPQAERRDADEDVVVARPRCVVAAGSQHEPEIREALGLATHRWNRLLDMEQQVIREEQQLAARPKERPVERIDDTLPDRTLEKKNADWQGQTRHMQSSLEDLRKLAETERRELEELRYNEEVKCNGGPRSRHGPSKFRGHIHDQVSEPSGRAAYLSAATRLEATCKASHLPLSDSAE